MKVNYTKMIMAEGVFKRRLKRKLCGLCLKVQGAAQSCEPPTQALPRSATRSLALSLSQSVEPSYTFHNEG